MNKKIEGDGFYIIFNAETGADIATAKIADAADPKKTKFVPELESFEQFKEEKVTINTNKVLKKKYKNQETIDKHMKEEVTDIDYKADYENSLEDYNNKIQMLAVNPPFAYVKLVTIIVNTGDKREIIQYENENNDKDIEYSIINKTVHLLHSKNQGNDSYNSHAIVTFNGKIFDIPLLIERGQVRNVTNLPYSWLERLTNRGDRENHYDMIEHRSYQNTPVNKLSLTRNLAIRFGIDFAKVQIDYATCSIEELKFYSLDQVLKLEYWHRFHHGLSIPSVKDFLASLPKAKEEENIELPEETGRELPDV